MPMSQRACMLERAMGEEDVCGNGVTDGWISKPMHVEKGASSGLARWRTPVNSPTHPISRNKGKSVHAEDDVKSAGPPLTPSPYQGVRTSTSWPVAACQQPSNEPKINAAQSNLKVEMRPSST